MTKSQIEKCKQIAKYYGENSQLGILFEEAAELIIAVSKVWREIPDADKKFMDGLADMSIMLEQVKSYLDDDEQTALSKLINAKLDAQLDIIKNKEK